jgi:hypothetical protein
MKAALTQKMRAWWSHLQGLDGRLAGAAAAHVLERTGWARSVGGAGPYLTLFARAGTSRAAADQAAAALEIYELPAARGCTYVVPASDFALALRAGAAFGEADMKTGRKLGVSDKEIDTLCEAVAGALAAGPLGPDEIRTATGTASRSLGEEGKKKGLTTTLPLALGRLQASGDIRRMPVNGRLDQQLYRYALWRTKVAACTLSLEEVHAELARRYFSWIGPATMAEFQWFSGLSAKAARTALDPLGLVPLEDGRLLRAEDRERWEAFEAPREPCYVLAGSLDGISLLRRDLSSLAEAADLSRALFAGSRGGVLDLPSHAIFDRGRLVGLWEYDPAAESIAWTAFIPRNRELEAAVRRMEEFVRGELGDARSFSLDSPKSRVPRIEALRAAAG